MCETEMNNHMILVCDNFGKEFLNRLSKFGDVFQSSDIDYSLPLDKITILVVRSKTKVNNELVGIVTEHDILTNLAKSIISWANLKN